MDARSSAASVVELGRRGGGLLRADAYCRDTSDTWVIADTTWSEADRCCCVAIEISLAAVVVSSTMPEIRSSASTTSRASSAPWWTSLGALLAGEDRRVGLGLDLGDDRLDLPGRLLRALGELAHLGGDDGEAAAVLAGPGRLDRGVEREQVGLVGEVVDDLEDAADLLALLAQRQRAVAIESTRPAIESMAPTDAVDGDPAVLGVAQRLGGVARDRLGGVGDLRGGGGELLDRRGGLGHRGGLLGGAGRVLLGGREQLAGALRELVAAAADLGDEQPQVRDGVVERRGQRADRGVRLATLAPPCGANTDRSPSDGAYEGVGQLADLGLELAPVVVGALLLVEDGRGELAADQRHDRDGDERDRTHGVVGRDPGVRQVARRGRPRRPCRAANSGVCRRLRISPVNSGTRMSITQPPPLRPPVTVATPVM